VNPRGGRQRPGGVSQSVLSSRALAERGSYPAVPQPGTMPAAFTKPAFDENSSLTKASKAAVWFQGPDFETRGTKVLLSDCSCARSS
jgi:hypothetical protein